MKRQNLAVILIVLLTFVSSCKRDVIDLDKISDRIENTRNIAMPLVLGSFSVEEFIDEDTDSNLVINGDTLSYFYREDSILSFEISEFVDISIQPKINYTIESDVNIDITGITIIDTNLLQIDTTYTFDFSDDMRIDSIVMDNCGLEIDITENTFDLDMDLIVSSESILTPEGNTFVDTIIGIQAGSTNSDETINLTGYKIILTNADGDTELNISYRPIVYNPGGATLISTGDHLDVEISFSDLENFKRIHGFFGEVIESFDTTLTDFFDEEIEGLDGELNITNPKFHLNYENSIGVSASADLTIKTMHADEPANDVTVEFVDATIYYNDDYLDPFYSGSIEFNKKTNPNISDLVSLPIPDEIYLATVITMNKDADPNSTMNYALWESTLDIGLEIEVPLELRADLTYVDTFNIEDLVADDVEITVNHANLNYWFKNYFPLGFDASLVLYDSISGTNLNTIELDESDTTLFLEPAPVDGNGEVIIQNVQKQDGVVELSGDQAYDLLNEATHVIVQAVIQTTRPDAVSSVRVAYESELEFQFGLDANLTYIYEPESDEENE